MSVPRRALNLAAAIAAAGALAVACGGGSGSGVTTPPATPTAPSGTTSGPPTTTTPPPSIFTAWDYSGDQWVPMGGTPPSCPNPLVLPLPVDLSRVTSILYPGQLRGGAGEGPAGFMPHGGFRFDGAGQTTSVTVSATMAAEVFRASRYLINGEIQYNFDLINSCGFIFRYGHLRDLPSRFQAIADSLPPATESDSRSYRVTTGQMVAAGETVATGVGFRDSSRNVFLDYGMYNLRQRNNASQDPAWLAAHPGDNAPYGVCWFDWLSAANAASVRALPAADSISGRTSDYCR